jgi:hypothetical protein
MNSCEQIKTEIMITREEYNKALDIVESYHKQLFIGSLRRSLSWEDLQAGHKIIFDKVMSKYLTEGKEYTVTRVDSYWKEWYDSWFEITDDRGSRKALRKHAKGYVVRMA